VSDDLSAPCPGCGLLAPIADRFCEACGARLAPVADGDHKEGDRRVIDVGIAAGLTNPGLVKPTNQDALYLNSADGRVVVVVCDGVSSSAAADAAARVACTAAGRALSQASPEPETAMHAAAGIAQRAVLGIPWSPAGDLGSPACTFVAALWDGRSITLGSAGDCRAYWIDGERALRLTTDDSWAHDQVVAGRMTQQEAESDPRAHQITRWLGADSPPEPTEVTTYVPDRPGRLAVCSDGLWNYASDADDVAALLRAPAGSGPPLTVARSLVDHALAAGGHDNITVAIVDVTPKVEEAS
jgi:serine/threonine protein phosphatase PrpC